MRLRTHKQMLGLFCLWGAGMEAGVDAAAAACGGAVGGRGIPGGEARGVPAQGQQGEAGGGLSAATGLHVGEVFHGTVITNFQVCCPTDRPQHSVQRRAASQPSYQPAVFSLHASPPTSSWSSASSTCSKQHEEQLRMGSGVLHHCSLKCLLH